MDEKTFNDQLAEILSSIESLPTDEQRELKDLVQKTKERYKDQKKLAEEIMDSIDYLRLSIKYLMFDLEATRRENSYLRRMLEEANQDRGNPYEDVDDDDDLV